MTVVRVWVRIEQERHPSPSEAIIDSQSVKSAAMVNQSVGFDALLPETSETFIYLAMIRIMVRRLA